PHRNAPACRAGEFTHRPATSNASAATLRDADAHRSPSPGRPSVLALPPGVKGSEDWSVRSGAVEQGGAGVPEDRGPPAPGPCVGDMPPGLGDDPAVVMVIRLVWRQPLATEKAKFFLIRGQGVPSNPSHP